MKSKDVIEANKALIQDFPFLLPHNRWTDKVPDDYDFSYTELDGMPDGWRTAFGLEMCRELKEILLKAGAMDAYRIMDIKEKYGTLRWYDNGFPVKTEREYLAWQSKFFNLSQRTCIKCGKKATKISVGYIAPYCSECASEMPFADFEILNTD
ncbi:MAG: hypothetical protein NC489_46535 [Ruminococcus flavefaciens]|nr:hypothetical protein [Ruminococcus flavefaciens]